MRLGKFDLCEPMFNAVILVDTVDGMISRRFAPLCDDIRVFHAVVRQDLVDNIGNFVDNVLHEVS